MISKHGVIERNSILLTVLILVVVFKHEEQKPKSAQDLAAAAFNQLFSVQEWKPGMGKKPLFYHPAAFNQLFSVQEWKPGMGKQPFFYHPAALDNLVWKPLPARPGQVQAGAPSPMP